MEFARLTERQLDALREIGNVGMGHAATALSQLTGKTVYLNVPRVMAVETAGMAELLGGGERMAVGIQLRMLGNAQGSILMIFPRENAVRIVAKLLPGESSGGDALTELELSALKEVGNILASAYLSALGEMLRMTLIPSVPALFLDTAGRVFEQALVGFGEAAGVALVLDTEFFTPDERISSQFFLFPAPSSLETILKALGMDNP